jgi:N-acyl-D-amino-acid deacylase
MQATSLGRTLRAESAPGEVRYYDPARDPSVFASDSGSLVPSAYGGWYLEAMDAHGGWLSSALDLARFAAAFNNPEKSPLLSRESIQEMFARPDGQDGDDSFYSLGWFNREAGGGYNHWHTGSLPGTATLLVLRRDGKAWVILFYTRESDLEAREQRHRFASASGSRRRIGLAGCRLVCDALNPSLSDGTKKPGLEGNSLAQSA